MYINNDNNNDGRRPGLVEQRAVPAEAVHEVHRLREVCRLCMYVCVYIYIYRERERERDFRLDCYVCVYIHIVYNAIYYAYRYVYIYIYICVCVGVHVCVM